MLSGIRKRFTYANVAMTLALVFAMSGGAYAASRYVITSTKQIKPSVLAQLRGRAGAQGAAGAQGPTGPAGPVGPQGPAGAGGAKGENGAGGVNGTSVTSVKLAPGKVCREGGSEFTSASGKTTACNGEKGAEGSPWVAGGILPEGQTLKGEFGASGYGEAKWPEPGFGVAASAVSFALPLTEQPTLRLINPGEPLPSGCTGEEMSPGADPGFLCLFISNAVNVGAHGSPFESTAFGFDISGLSEGKGAMAINGTWAATAK